MHIIFTVHISDLGNFVIDVEIHQSNNSSLKQKLLIFIFSMSWWYSEPYSHHAKVSFPLKSRLSLHEFSILNFFIPSAVSLQEFCHFKSSCCVHPKKDTELKRLQRSCFKPTTPGSAKKGSKSGRRPKNSITINKTQHSIWYYCRGGEGSWVGVRCFSLKLGLGRNHHHGKSSET